MIEQRGMILVNRVECLRREPDPIEPVRVCTAQIDSGLSGATRARHSGSRPTPRTTRVGR